MDRLLYFIISNSGPLSLVLLSVGLSFYWIRNAFYRKGKRLSYAVKLCEKVSVTDHPAKSHILVWNWGRDVIRYEDFTSQGQLQVLSEDKIYNAELIGATDDYLQVIINGVDHGFAIAPEYLERGDGFIVRMEHNDEARLILQGKIMGGRLYRSQNPGFWYTTNFFIHLLASLSILAGYVLFCVWLFGYLSLYTNYGGMFDWLILPGLISMGTLAIYLAVSFDAQVWKIHRLVRKHF